MPAMTATTQHSLRPDGGIGTAPKSIASLSLLLLPPFIPTPLPKPPPRCPHVQKSRPLLQTGIRISTTHTNLCDLPSLFVPLQSSGPYVPLDRFEAWTAQYHAHAQKQRREERLQRNVDWEIDFRVQNTR